MATGGAARSSSIWVRFPSSTARAWGLWSRATSVAATARAGSALARIDKRINNLFLITKLAFVFETFDTVEEALVGQAQSGVTRTEE